MPKVPSANCVTVQLHKTINIINMLELNTEKDVCMSNTAHEDAQRPRAVYDIYPDFRGI